MSHHNNKGCTPAWIGVILLLWVFALVVVAIMLDMRITRLEHLLRPPCQLASSTHTPGRSSAAD